MGKYFDKFQTILYNNTPVKNVMSRVIIDDENKKKFSAYVPYTMSEDLNRPDLLSYKYYGNSYYDWMIYLSNGVIDPYYDTYKTDSDFNNYIIGKYGSIQRAIDTIAFYRNNWVETINDDILPVNLYDNLNKNLKKYYDPKINTSNQVIGYIRKQVDWVVNTNKVRNITASTEFLSNSDIGDILVQKINTSIVATGIVSSFSETSITVEKITGTFVNTAGNIIYTKYSGIFSTATNISNPSSYFDENETLIEFDNIPDSEASFWSPINCYEYEKEINEAKKELILIKASQRPSIEKQLMSNLR
jgi:hypothetical protein